MIKDKMLIGALIGILADAVKLIANYILFSLGYTKVVFWQIVASIFLRKEHLYDKLAYLIGAVADATFTSLLGVIFVYIIYLFGAKNLWLKGMGFGLVVWVSVFGILVSRIAGEKLPQDPTGVVVTIIAHVVFGLALAFFTKLFKQDKPVSIIKNKSMHSYKLKK